MTRLLVVFLGLGLFSGTSFASQGGFGFSGGLLVPVGSEHMKDRSGLGWTGGLHLRSFVTPAFGIDFSYDRLEFGEADENSNGLRVDGNAYTVSLISRPIPYSKATPVFGLGVGAATIQDLDGNPSSFTNWAFKAKVGVDFWIQPQATLGLHMDYHYVTTSNSSRNEVHAIKPVLGFTYYVNTLPARKQSPATASTGVPQKAPAPVSSATTPASVPVLAPTPTVQVPAYVPQQQPILIPLSQ